MRGLLRKKGLPMVLFAIALLALLGLGLVNVPAAATNTLLDTFAPTGDTYIDWLRPNTPQYDGTWLMYREDDHALPLLKFDVSRLRGASIRHATLRLYAVPDIADTSQYKTPCWFAAYCVLTDWDAQSATWNQPWNTPGCGSSTDRCTTYSGTGSLEARSGGIWVDVDVTTIVQSWVDGENHGLILRNYAWHSEVGNQGKAVFYSTRFANPGYHPRLEVEYVFSTPTRTATRTATSTSTATATPTCTATSTWTPTRIATATYTDTPTSTPTETLLPTETATPTQMPTSMPTETSTHTPTGTPTATETATATPSATRTPYKVYLPLLWRAAS